MLTNVRLRWQDIPPIGHIFRGIQVSRISRIWYYSQKLKMRNHARIVDVTLGWDAFVKNRCAKANFTCHSRNLVPSKNMPYTVAFKVYTCKWLERYGRSQNAPTAQTNGHNDVTFNYTQMQVRYQTICYQDPFSLMLPGSYPYCTMCKSTLRTQYACMHDHCTAGQN